MGVKVLRLRRLKFVVELVRLVPEVEPVEGVGQVRDGGKGGGWKSHGAAHDLAGCQIEPAPCFLSTAAALCRLLRSHAALA
jgi:hypothetical protein